MKLLAGCGIRGRWGALGVVCFVGIAAGVTEVAVVAQDAGVFTMHAYENTIQIPVLVLSSSRDRLKEPIAADKFSVSMDSGPWFRATHVRQEGDDPISLGILVDARGSQAELLPKLNEAIAGLAPGGLRPHDHVSIYMMDCSEVHIAKTAAEDPARLKLAVDTALQAWTNRGAGKKGPECQRAGPLWNILAYMTQALSNEPGRPVILAITDGEDRGSTHTWNEVKTFAQATGVTIFGLKDTLSAMPRDDVKSPFDERPFQWVCELSGGTVLLANGSNIADTLKLFTTMLRERYIVEFPRPSNATAGAHSINVRVERSNDFIRPSGISVPIADPALKADPTTVPSDPSLAPTMGKSRPVAPK